MLDLCFLQWMNCKWIEGWRKKWRIWRVVTHVKWSFLCTCNEDRCGSVGIVPVILNFGSKWKFVVSFTSRPFYPSGKACRFHVSRRLGGLQSWSGYCRIKNLLLLPTLEPRLLCYPARNVGTVQSQDPSLFSVSLWCADSWSCSRMGWKVSTKIIEHFTINDRLVVSWVKKGQH